MMSDDVSFTDLRAEAFQQPDLVIAEFDFTGAGRPANRWRSRPQNCDGSRKNCWRE
jgi:hypothetical protein